MRTIRIGRMMEMKAREGKNDQDVENIRMKSAARIPRMMMEMRGMILTRMAGMRTEWRC